MKKISVIVPVYKAEEYLERCVRSICRQTFENLEILLVDDGSPDNSGLMCDRFAELDSRIRVIHKENGGLSDARNAGIEQSTGDYIAFVDSDDWLDPTMLSVLYNLCESHEAGIAECSYRNFFPDKTQTETECSGEVVEFTPIQAIESNLDWGLCKPVAWNKLYHRDVVGNIRYPYGKIHEDEFTTHLFYLAAKKIVYIDRAFYNYERRNVGSITASFKLKNLDSCEAFRQKVHLVWERPELHSLDKKMCNTYCYILFDMLQKCRELGLSGSEVTRTIYDALEDFPQLKAHGIDRNYIVQFNGLYAKYRDGFKKDRGNKARNKKISVIVPVYEVESYLERCVNSICHQTHDNLEILLVDDGSPDNSGLMCDHFAEFDRRIRVIHKKNGGLSDARNVGIEQSSGDYIAFVDGDDWLDPTMLSTLYKLCESRHAEIAECSFRSIFPEYTQSETSCSGAVMEFTPVQAIESNLDWKYCKPLACNKLYRRDIVANIRYPLGKIHEDEFTTHLFYLAAKKIVYVDIAFYNYERRNPGSITASFKLKNLDSFEAFRQKLHLVWDRPDLQALDEKMCNSYCYVLFDKLQKCREFKLSGPELTKMIYDALEDRPALEDHGVSPGYIKQLDALYAEYGEEFEEARRAKAVK